MQFGIQPKTGGTYHGLCSIIVTTKQCTGGPACLSDLQNFLNSHDTPKLHHFYFGLSTTNQRLLY